MLLRSTWQDTIEQLDALLGDMDCRFVKSFDLQLARQGLQDPASCPCPHHGTAECTCQYLVYLVYAGPFKPLTVVVHGYDNQTEVTMEPGPDDDTLPVRRRIIQHLIARRSGSRPRRGGSR